MLSLLIKQSNEMIVEEAVVSVVQTIEMIIGAITAGEQTIARDQQELTLAVVPLLRIVLQAIVEKIEAHQSLLEIKVAGRLAEVEMIVDGTTEAETIAAEGVMKIAIPVREDQRVSNLQSQSRHSPKACSKEKNHCVLSPISCSS
jgi:hypothetical protein